MFEPKATIEDLIKLENKIDSIETKVGMIMSHLGLSLGRNGFAQPIIITKERGELGNISKTTRNCTRRIRLLMDHLGVEENYNLGTPAYHELIPKNEVKDGE